MVRRMFICAALLAVMAMLLLPVSSQGLVIKKDRFQLVRESVSILTGEVVSLRSYWTPGRKQIHTEVTVKVSEYLKGDEGRLVKFTVPGGTVDDMTMRTSVTPLFSEGEKVLLFLNNNNECRLAGWFQGKYIIEGDTAYPAGPVCRRILDEELAIPLDDLLQEIRLLVAVGPIEPLTN